MRYTFLICTDEAGDIGPADAGYGEMMAGYGAFTQELEQRKLAFSGARLRPPATAATVRVHNGKTTTTDGPFAETKEHLGGFFIVDCKDLDEALELAAMLPGAQQGSVEVRPVWEM